MPGWTDLKEKKEREKGCLQHNTQTPGDKRERTHTDTHVSKEVRVCVCVCGESGVWLEQTLTFF